MTGKMLLLSVLLVSSITVVHSGKIETTADCMMYLSKYGYVRPTTEGANMNEEDITAAIYKFQSMAHIAETGKCDEATKAMMNMPRCGFPDFDDDDVMDAKRKKRYVLYHTKWSKTDLTYRVNSVTPDIPDPSLVKNTFANALRVWSEVTTLTFANASWDEAADFVINFYGEGHDLDIESDGPGRVLAFALLPEDGRSFFDDNETWSINESPLPGIDLFLVAVHEFGHSLGLLHSNITGAVMAPYYRYDPNFRLHEDDIAGIQALYGDPNITRPTTPMPTATNPGPTTTSETTTTPQPTSTPQPQSTRLPSTPQPPSGQPTSGQQPTTSPVSTTTEPTTIPRRTSTPQSQSTRLPSTPQPPSGQPTSGRQPATSPVSTTTEPTTIPRRTSTPQSSTTPGLTTTTETATTPSCTGERCETEIDEPGSGGQSTIALVLLIVGCAVLILVAACMLLCMCLLVWRQHKSLAYRDHRQWSGVPIRNIPDLSREYGDVPRMAYFYEEEERMSRLMHVMRRSPYLQQGLPGQEEFIRPYIATGMEGPYRQDRRAEYAGRVVRNPMAI
ncbi:hatching enzyme-like [Patiria miniata]|uniref:Peptidase metallopeptidase domain-containing protein n=1 Tax=Patiria miniata TaxID=46514 RepID=A0A913Z7T1_PATMI|nr:hatching enzyme-like [Patiria miniata]